MKIVKPLFILLCFFGLIYFIYLNLGRFLDATSNPSKTDLLVCLGGGNYKTRSSKTLELYKKGYVKSHTILLTNYANSKREVQKGLIEDKRLHILKSNISQPIHIILNKKPRNTVEEVLYIKHYMLKHHLKNVTIVTEPPHSRRVLIFFKLFSINGDDHLQAKVVGANYAHWNAKTYYENKYTRSYAFSEVTKLIFGIFVYYPLYKFHLLSWFDAKNLRLKVDFTSF